MSSPNSTIDPDFKTFGILRTFRINGILRTFRINGIFEVSKTSMTSMISQRLDLISQSLTFRIDWVSRISSISRSFISDQVLRLLELAVFRGFLWLTDFIICMIPMMSSIIPSHKLTCQVSTNRTLNNSIIPSYICPSQLPQLSLYIPNIISYHINFIRHDAMWSNLPSLFDCL